MIASMSTVAFAEATKQSDNLTGRWIPFADVEIENSKKSAKDVLANEQAKINEKKPFKFTLNLTSTLRRCVMVLRNTRNSLNPVALLSKDCQ